MRKPARCQGSSPPCSPLPASSSWRIRGGARARLATSCRSTGTLAPTLRSTTRRSRRRSARVRKAAAAKAAGLDPKQVKVHTTFLGGGFGRRLEVDFIPAAVEASNAVKKPVKLIWTREDDMTHDAYRPPAFDQVTGAFDAKGNLVA